MSEPAPWLIIANPENRRVTLFQEALARAGHAPAQVLSWATLACSVDSLRALPDTPRLARIDAAGESFEVERALLRRGHSAAQGTGCATLAPEKIDALKERRGRLLCPRQLHLGFEQLLREIEAVFAERPAWRVLNPPADIRELFDKRRSSPRFAGAGIPVPEVLGDVHDLASLRAEMQARGLRRAWLKLSCGSSASGLAVYSLRGDGGFLMTTMAEDDEGLYNSLRVQRVQRRDRIEARVEFLCREGVHVEADVPKAKLDGALFDCRVLLIAGEPAFIVVRQSHHPITNLHLGGWRGDLDALRRRVPAAAWDSAMDSCRRVAALYPGTLHLGVDLLFEARSWAHRVIEANAFGDLLPGLAREGLDVYGWELRAAGTRSSNPSP